MIVIACLYGCDSSESDSDPWGCNDQKPLALKDTVLPVAHVGEAYVFDFSPFIHQNLTLLDSSKAGQYGLGLNKYLFEGIPTKTTAIDSFRIVGWENGTQCLGRVDTFTAYLSINQ
jgi:hypothetical protein